MMRAREESESEEQTLFAILRKEKKLMAKMHQEREESDRLVKERHKLMKKIHKLEEGSHKLDENNRKIMKKLEELEECLRITKAKGKKKGRSIEISDLYSSNCKYMFISI